MNMFMIDEATKLRKSGAMTLAGYHAVIDRFAPKGEELEGLRMEVASKIAKLTDAERAELEARVFAEASEIYTPK